jgi:hypothetical membrane protein
MTGPVPPRWAVMSAILSPLVFTIGWLVAGRLQPPSYNPIRQTVSVMAGQPGTDRWVMTAALIGVGVFYLVTAAGLRAVGRPARLMLIVAGACSFGIAASPEPATGPTVVHLAFTGVGATMIAFWPAVASRGARGGRGGHFLLTARGYAIVTVGFLAMLAWTVLETRGGPDLGLAERLTASVQTTWPFVVALLLRWHSQPGSGQAESAQPPLMSDPSGELAVPPGFGGPPAFGGPLSGGPPPDSGPSSGWPLARS